MKARIEIPKMYRPQIEDYINEEVHKRVRKQQLAIIRRTLKLVAIALSEKDLGGFGAIRIRRMWERVNEYTEKMEKDFVGWARVDRDLIDKMKLPIEREDYDEIERWYRHNGQV